MDKYEEVIKEMTLKFCVKLETFEVSTLFDKSYLQSSVI